MASFSMRGLILSLLGGLFMQVEAITPMHLASLFENVHDMSFRCWHANRGASPTVDEFLRKYRNKEKFLAAFGFDLSVERELFVHFFEKLKLILLIPEEVSNVFSTARMPCMPPFWIALDVATLFLMELNKRQCDSGNSNILWYEDFLYEATFENYKRFLDLFCAKLAIKIEAVNKSELAARKKTREKITTAVPSVEADTQTLPDAAASEKQKESQDAKMEVDQTEKEPGVSKAAEEVKN